MAAARKLINMTDLEASHRGSLPHRIARAGQGEGRGRDEAVQAPGYHASVAQATPSATRRLEAGAATSSRPFSILCADVSKEGARQQERRAVRVACLLRRRARRGGRDAVRGERLRGALLISCCASGLLRKSVWATLTTTSLDAVWAACTSCSADWSACCLRRRSWLRHRRHLALRDG